MERVEGHLNIIFDGDLDARVRRPMTIVTPQGEVEEERKNKLILNLLLRIHAQAENFMYILPPNYPEAARQGRMALTHQEEADRRESYIASLQELIGPNAGCYLHIHSDGGDASVKTAYTNLLEAVRRNGGKSTAIVPSRACSAAAELALECDEILTTPGSQLHIHGPIFVKDGGGGKERTIYLFPDVVENHMCTIRDRLKSRADHRFHGRLDRDFEEVLSDFRNPRAEMKLEIERLRSMGIAQTLPLDGLEAAWMRGMGASSLPGALGAVSDFWNRRHLEEYVRFFTAEPFQLSPTSLRGGRLDPISFRTPPATQAAVERLLTTVTELAELYTATNPEADPRIVTHAACRTYTLLSEQKADRSGTC